MKISSIFSTLLLIANALSADVVVDANKYQEGKSEIGCEDVTISEGKYWYLSNAKYIKINGDFHNDGDFFVGSDKTDIDIHLWLGKWNHEVVNNGNIVVSSGDSFFSPKFRIDGGSFENNGKIFVAGYGKTGIPVSEITSKSFHNKGEISFYQDKRNSGLVHLGKLWGSMKNDGTVCLRNQAFAQHARINGEGCFDIGENSNVWIRSAALPISQDQTFFFSSTGGSIRVEAVSAPQTFKIRNWGLDNVIGLSLPISSFRYNAEGLLTLKCGLLEYHFDIGTGYDFSKIKQVTADFGTGIGTVINGGLVYDGPAPTTDRPEICAACDEVPSPPVV